MKLRVPVKVTVDLGGESTSALLINLSVAVRRYVPHSTRHSVAESATCRLLLNPVATTTRA